MNILPGVLMFFSLQLGVIPMQGSEKLFTNQINPCYYVEFAADFQIAKRLTIKTSYENNFTKSLAHSYISFSPLKDTFYIGAEFAITPNFLVVADHFCVHAVDNPSIDINRINTGLKAQTKIGIKIKN